MVTGDQTDEANPAFDLTGRYLYFVSFRDFNFANEGFDARIYTATLRADLPHPFPPQSDEEPAGEAEADESSSGDEEETDDSLRIDLDGLGDRVVALPGVNSGFLTGLVGLEDGLLFFGGGGLQKYSLEERESETIFEGIQG